MGDNPTDAILTSLATGERGAAIARNRIPPFMMTTPGTTTKTKNVMVTGEAALGDRTVRGIRTTMERNDTVTGRAGTVKIAAPGRGLLCDQKRSYWKGCPMM